MTDSIDNDRAPGLEGAMIGLLENSLGVDILDEWALLPLTVTVPQVHLHTAIVLDSDWAGQE